MKNYGNDISIDHLSIKYLLLFLEVGVGIDRSKGKVGVGVSRLVNLNEYFF